MDWSVACTLLLYTRKGNPLDCGKNRLLFRNNQDSSGVLILTETWLSSGNLCDLEGYQAHYICRTNRSSGGVSVYVESNFVF